MAILRMAGLTDAQVVRVLELEQQERLASRREQNRINQQNHRAHKRVIADSADSADPLAKVPRKPPKTQPQDSEGLRPSADREPMREDLEREFFNRGKQVCGKNSGGLLASLLKAKRQDIALARSTLELAATKADPREFVAAACRVPPYINGHAAAPRPGSREDRAERTANALAQLRRQAGFNSDEPGRSGPACDDLAGFLPFAKPAGS